MEMYKTNNMIPRKYILNRLKRPQPEEGQLYFSNQLLGDSYAEVCSSVLDTDEVRETSIVNLKNNRLTHRGIKCLMDKMPAKVSLLDLS
jgi:hypothetical protein